MSEHLSIHHGDKPHTCYYCGRSFTLRCNLIRHVRIHTGDKRFACDYCDKAFVLKKNLIEHHRTHTGEKPFVCTVCDKSFGRRSSLMRHIRTHTGEKEFVCHFCTKSFAWKYYLRRHMEIHLDAINRSSAKVYNPPKRLNFVRPKSNYESDLRPEECISEIEYILDEKNNVCDRCGMTFEDKQSFIDHIEQHDNYVVVEDEFYVGDSITPEQYEKMTIEELVICCEQLEPSVICYEEVETS